MERRLITSREVQRQQADSTPVAPGIWLEANGDVHFSIPDLLALVGLPDTFENREAVVAIAEEVVREAGAALIRQDVQDG